MNKKLINKDSLDFLRETTEIWECGICDIPDNLGLDYDGYKDKLSDEDYFNWVELFLRLAVPRFKVLWFTFYHRYLTEFCYRLRPITKHNPREVRCYPWRFLFGQYSETDSPSGWRPFLRIASPTWKPRMVDRVPSVREKMGDLRATGKGRVQDDVFEECRIQGNNSERRAFHPTQIPEAIYRRISNMSTDRGQTVVDLFAGTGTLFRAIKDRPVIGVEQSEFYCKEIAKEHNLEIQNA